MRTGRIAACGVLAVAVWAAGRVVGQTVPTTRPTAAVPSSADVDANIQSLLKPPAGPGRPLPPAASGGTDKTGGPAAVAPGAPAVKLVREGTHLTQRVGRLNHTADGNTAVFTFDADGAAMKDPPMIILQNLALEQMESTQVGQSRDTRFRVSGTVTEYKGRNYVLLDTATAVPDVDANF